MSRTKVVPFQVFYTLKIISVPPTNSNKINVPYKYWNITCSYDRNCGFFLRVIFKGAGNLLSKIGEKRELLSKIRGCELFSRVGYIPEFTVFVEISSPIYMNRVCF